jgi:hypothetical protein
MLFLKEEIKVRIKEKRRRNILIRKAGNLEVGKSTKFIN